MFGVPSITFSSYQIQLFSHNRESFYYQLHSLDLIIKKDENIVYVIEKI